MSKSLEEKIGMHCFISGKVQGVWYRASTQDKAVSLGLTGWARNLEDGRVEVKAFGTRQQLAELHAWLKIGPELAKVTDVIQHDIGYESHERFGVK
jgi:acylphosphatase